MMAMQLVKIVSLLLALYLLFLFFNINSSPLVTWRAKKHLEDQFKRELVLKEIDPLILGNFQVQVANAGTPSICLKPQKLKLNADFFVHTCDVHDKSQHFRLDVSGQMHLMVDDTLCLVAQRHKRSLKLQKCRTDSGAKFSIKETKDKNGRRFEFLWKLNPKFKLSCSLVDGGKVFLAKSDSRILQVWKALPINQLTSQMTYVPGLLSIEENGLILSKGLASRIIAQSNQKVAYANGNRSRATFHARPDGAAVFEIKSGLYSGG